MKRFVLIAVLALALMLAGASAVLAQDNAPEFGHMMLQAPGANGPDASPTGPAGPGRGAVCPMAGGAGNAHIMNSPEMQDAHQQMQNGNWDAMRNACQKAWDKNQGSSRQA